MDLQNLYRQVIMDHYKNPRNKGLVGHKQMRLRNPSCGDDITIEAKIEDNILKEIHHEGSGCSICCSSASVMSELLTGKDTDTAKKIIKDYYNLVTGVAVDDEEALEEALVYQGVSQFPARTKCATIAWKALEQLIGVEESE